jgi:hypothetical protein
VGNYISESEKDAYGIGLFDSTISGTEKNPVDCVEIPLNTNKCENIDDDFNDINDNNIRKLGHKYSFTQAMYGGECNIEYNDYIYKNNGTLYKIYKKNENDNFDNSYNCNSNKNIVTLLIRNSGVTISIDIEGVESSFYGNLNKEEILSILQINQPYTYADIKKLFDNRKTIINLINYLKIPGNNLNYYNVKLDDSFVFNFTTCGVIGKIGPTQTQCNNEYGTNFVTVEGGKQIWRVPQTGKYKITTIGADSYGLNPQGRVIVVEYNLSEGTDIKMTVGQKPAPVQGLESWRI